MCNLLEHELNLMVVNGNQKMPDKQLAKRRALMSVVKKQHIYLQIHKW